MPDKRPAKRPVKRITPPPRVPDEDEEASSNGDEETPTPPKMQAGSARRLRPGWSAGQETMDSTSTYAQSYRPGENIEVIKFLDDHPYASFRRHWIEGVNNEGARIVRAWTCGLSFGDECPLCEVGDKPQAVSSFNIAICGDDGEVTRKSWDVGARLFNVLKSYANDTKIAPLTKGFFLVNKSGKKGSTQYNVTPVKPSALEEDYDVPVPKKEALDALDRYDIDIVEVPPLKKLRELAAEISDDD